MKKLRPTPQQSAASMADIAFLLLIFFMVTTTIVNDKGLDLVLPPYLEENKPAEFNERNIFTILINSQDKLLIENEPRENHINLREEIKTFVLNKGQQPNWSDDPKSALVSIKSNRGTSQYMFIKILDEAKAAYYEIYGQMLHLSPEAVRNNTMAMQQRHDYKELRKEIPMNISIAEPD